MSEKVSFFRKTISSIRNHILFLSLLLFLYILSLLSFIYQPKGPMIPELKQSYVLFGSSLTAFLLLVSIGINLIYRFYHKAAYDRETIYQLIWGVSFLIYSLVFVGLGLHSVGVKFANVDQPEFFFMWRFPMIIWCVGMWLGFMMLFTENKLFIYLPSLIIFLWGLFGFYYGLIVLGNIERTMYAFLYSEFIPVTLIFAYLWLQYSKDTHLSSTKVLSAGFIIMSISYAAWAPWHSLGLIYIYFIWFDIFIFSLALILAGFFALPKEIAAHN